MATAENERMRRMTNPSVPGNPYPAVPARPCSGPPTSSDTNPRHLRPAGGDLEMLELNAADYDVPRVNGRMQRMNMRPFLDVVAAKHDGCHPCQEHHINLIAADPVLTTHVVAVALMNLGVHEASARQLLQHLDPDGCAIALTIRNRGLVPAVELARSKTLDQRTAAAQIAINAIVATQWYGCPISNYFPPDVARSTDHLGDEMLMSDLGHGGYL